MQDKFWVPSTDNRAWEIYTVLADAPLTEEPAAACAGAHPDASAAGQAACNSTRTA